MNLHISAIVRLLALAVALMFSVQARATWVVIGPLTNSIGGGAATNDVVVFTVGSTANADGSYSVIALPKRFHLAPNGSVTNFFMQGNYIFTNVDIGMAVGFGGFPNDAGPTVYRASDWLIPGRFGALNFFVTRIITNGVASITFNAVTNALGYLPQSGLVATNSFDPTNSAATAAAAERLALISTNGQTLAAVAGTNTFLIADITAGTNAAVAGAQVTLIASNLLILATATNLTTIERNALIATNAILLADITAERTALIATNALLLADLTAERNALIATNNQSLIALAAGTNAAVAGAQVTLISSNLLILATATNLTAIERNALIATNTLLLADISAERNALIATNALLLADIIAATNGYQQGITNIINGVAGAGNFIANNGGNGTNTVLATAKSVGVTNLNVLGIGPNPGSISFPHGDKIYELAAGTASQSWDSGLSIGLANGIIWDEIGSTVLGSTNDIAGGGVGVVSFATIAGGVNNSIGDNNGSGSYSVILGGQLNKIPTSSWSAILGGWSNQIIGSTFGTTLGGYSNVVTGVVKSGVPAFGVAAGANATVSNLNSFVWNDNAAGTFGTTSNNQFLIHSSAGVGINTNNPGTNALKTPGWIDAGGFSAAGIPVLLTNTGVPQNGNATNVTSQGTLSLGGNTNYLAQGMTVVGVQGGEPLTEGTLDRTGANTWTNRSLIQNGLPAGGMTSNGTSFFLVNNAASVRYSATDVRGPWSVVGGALPVPVSWIGASNLLTGVLIQGTITSSNLNYQITNQAALIALKATNGLGTSAFLSSNLFVRTTGKNSVTNDSSGGFAITNPASQTIFSIQTNGSVIIGSIDNPDLDAGYIQIKTNGDLYIQGGSSAVSGSESSILLSSANSGQGYVDIEADDQTGIYRFGDLGGMLFQGIGGVKIVMTQPEYAVESQGVADCYIGIDSAIALSGGSISNRSLHLYAEPNGSVFLEGTNVTVTNNFMAKFIYVTNTAVASNFVGGASGLTNFSLASLNIVTTNSGRISTNFTLLIGQNLTNFIDTNAINLSNSISAALFGTTNLNKFNVNTNLLIAGVSQEGIYTGAIKLVATNGVPWSLVYVRVGPFWTNYGSTYSIITNGNGLTPQWNLRDGAGDVLSFKAASTDPDGKWTANFIATNAPTGDWGRTSDFGSGGNAEAWFLQHIPFAFLPNNIVTNQDSRPTLINNLTSGLLTINDGTFQSLIITGDGSSRYDATVVDSVLRIQEGACFLRNNTGMGVFFTDDSGEVKMGVDGTTALMEINNSGQVNIADISGNGLSSDGSGNFNAALNFSVSGVISGNGSGITNLVARPNLTFQTNTIYATTNTAPVTRIANPITLGNSLTTYNARTRYTVQFVLNDSAVSGSPALVFTNFTAGTVWTNGNTFVLAAGQTTTWTPPTANPGDVVGFYDKSSGAASVTLVKSEAEKF